MKETPAVCVFSPFSSPRLARPHRACLRSCAPRNKEGRFHLCPALLVSNCLSCKGRFASVCRSKARGALARALVSNIAALGRPAVEAGTPVSPAQTFLLFMASVLCSCFVATPCQRLPGSPSGLLMHPLCKIVLPGDPCVVFHVRFHHCPSSVQLHFVLCLAVFFPFLLNILLASVAFRTQSGVITSDLYFNTQLKFRCR